MSGSFGRELTDHERAILQMAIDTMPVGREQAHAQLTVAKHGRPAHAGTHPCFFITVPNAVDLIPPGSEHPLTLYVAPDEHTVGTIELFIEDGRLDSLDWSEVSLTDNAPEVTEFPSLARIFTEMNLG
ncbi:hypothetical protein QMG83_15145 [Salinibacterium sp. G-O1]|uniref:hypothetical protein n=1 Tax=Salinibacterium sp. G-O1 TaxID=3046208 RepID=UPI0024BA68F9|nr:hypothetical protein [Salinibacterium sp. G-O1]MDJ0336563.1 hypothetical protein [Salinibacterium sp. G-O1]